MMNSLRMSCLLFSAGLSLLLEGCFSNCVRWDTRTAYGPNGSYVQNYCAEWKKDPAEEAATREMLRKQEESRARDAALAAEGEKNYAAKYPLHTAVKNGDVDKAKQLLAAGANPKALDGSGRQPIQVLNYFEYSGRKATVVELLINKGADVNIDSDEIAPALHQASYAGNYYAVEFLLSTGAKINLLHKGETPLDWALNAQKNTKKNMSFFNPSYYEKNRLKDLDRVEDFLKEKGAMKASQLH